MTIKRTAMFSETDPTDNGIFTIDVSADPTYFAWQQASAQQRALMPSLLQPLSELALRPTGSDVASVSIVSDGASFMAFCVLQRARMPAQIFRSANFL